MHTSRNTERNSDSECKMDRNRNFGSIPTCGITTPFFFDTIIEVYITDRLEQPPLSSWTHAWELHIRLLHDSGCSLQESKKFWFVEIY